MGAVIPADKILSFIAILEASPRLVTTEKGYYEGFHHGRLHVLDQVKSYVEAVLASEQGPTLREIEEAS